MNKLVRVAVTETFTRVVYILVPADVEKVSMVRVLDEIESNIMRPATTANMRATIEHHEKTIEHHEIDLAEAPINTSIYHIKEF